MLLPLSHVQLRYQSVSLHKHIINTEAELWDESFYAEQEHRWSAVQLCQSSCSKTDLSMISYISLNVQILNDRNFCKHGYVYVRNTCTCSLYTVKDWSIFNILLHFNIRPYHVLKYLKSILGTGIIWNMKILVDIFQSELSESDIHYYIIII